MESLLSDPVFVWSMLLGAAFLGGALNAVAGGGTFFTLPALVLAGVPAVAANASGTVALLPGYIASTWGFRDHLQAPRGLPLPTLVGISAAGGALGASLLLVTPEAAFRSVVPWLLLLATLLFAAGPALLGALNRVPGGQASGPAQAAALFAVAVYGGYFNGGLGIVLLAAFGLLGHADLNAMNGLKNLISAILTAIAVGLYALGGVVVWAEALGMMVAAVVGGYVAARAARRLPAVVIRGIVVATGAVMTALFFAA